MAWKLHVSLHGCHTVSQAANPTMYTRKGARLLEMLYTPSHPAYIYQQIDRYAARHGPKQHCTAPAAVSQDQDIQLCCDSLALLSIANLHAAALVHQLLPTTTTTTAVWQKAATLLPVAQGTGRFQQGSAL